jgi:hypothetical protein
MVVVHGLLAGHCNFKRNMDPPTLIVPEMVNRHGVPSRRSRIPCEVNYCATRRDLTSRRGSLTACCFTQRGLATSKSGEASDGFFLGRPK